MKTRTIQALIYGIFIVGASIAFLAVAVPSLSAFLTVFTYFGGAIVLFGIVLCIALLRIPCCPFCRELFSIRNQQPSNCPHCGENL